MPRALSLLSCIALLSMGCGKADCEDGAYDCSDDGGTLMVCEDGAWVEDEVCTDAGMMCHAEMGHCMVMDDM